MTEPAALSAARIADLLAASATTVVAELVALGPTGGWRPAHGEWSANECIGHLIEAERRGFSGRIRRILATDRPDISADLEGWDPPAVAASRRDHLRSGAELAAEFEALRADGVSLVRQLGPAEMDRVGLHPEVAPCASTTCSGNGSITTAATSGSSWRSPRRGSGPRWAMPGGSASRTSRCDGPNR